ncbi:MAG: metal ABC transporter permease [Solirubrobacterales bacterium]
MEIWYRLVEHLLPFGWVQYDFMKNALLAVILVAPIFGLTGTMVVNNRMAFFSDAIGHAALTGIALGVLLNLADPLWAMIIFAVILAVLMVMARLRTEASPDTTIGVFFATAVALGIVILSRGGGFNKYSRYLIGDLLSVTPTDIAMLLGVCIIVLLFWVFFYNRLFLTSFNPSVAASRGIRVVQVEIVFAVMIALVVTVSIQWVGLLIINSLLILPAAAARNITRSMKAYNAAGVLISLLSGITGLILSYAWGTATGATIVLVTFAIYAATAWMRVR